MQVPQIELGDPGRLLAGSQKRRTLKDEGQEARPGSGGACPLCSHGNGGMTKKSPACFWEPGAHETSAIAVGGCVLAGKEARELRHQEQPVLGCEWLVNEFGLCPGDSTHCQHRSFTRESSNQICFCGTVTQVSVWRTAWSGDSGGQLGC